MTEVRILPTAREDLIEIEIYLSLNAPAQVERVMTRLGDKIQLLAEQPMMGRVRYDLRGGGDLRSFREKPYLIFYRPLFYRPLGSDLGISDPTEGGEEVRGVEVVRVLHESRDIDTEFASGE